MAHDVTICSPLNLPAEMPAHASELYARNITELLELLVDDEGKLALDFSDEIVAGACVAAPRATHDPADGGRPELAEGDSRTPDAGDGAARGDVERE